MNSAMIPVDVQEFIARHVDGIAQLEALLLLRREPQTRWDGPSLAARLYISPAEALGVLEHWRGRGLFAFEDPVYAYRPPSEEAAAVVERLAQFYVTHLIPITNLIHSRPAKRIQAFADAFKFKKGS
jgi:hypothetical protein